jgi:hypothetical protein
MSISELDELLGDVTVNLSNGEVLPKYKGGVFGSGVPVLGVTGLNGVGKTLIGVDRAIADMASGRPVYSTVPIHSPYGDSIPITSLRQLLTLHDCTAFFDEAAAVFSSHGSQSLPSEVEILLQTLRHRNVTVIWTAPSWMRVDKRLRESTQAVITIMPLIKGSRKKLWSTPRVVMAGMLDCSSGKVDEVPTKVLGRRLFIPRRVRAWGTYDTLADTPMIGGHRQGGPCPDCGGTRTSEKCSEERHGKLGLPWYADDLGELWRSVPPVIER